MIVTGGATGIGEQIVKSFVAQGSKVGFLDFDQKNSERLQRELNNQVTFEICNLTENEKNTQFTIFRESNDLQTLLIWQINR